MKSIVYRGFEIDLCTYSKISVFYQGDDFLFNSVGDAKAFIDRIYTEDQEAAQ